MNSNGSPAVILSLILKGKIKLLYDNRILSKYSKVLKRNKFKFKIEWIISLLDFIQNEGKDIIANPVNKILKDKQEKKYYEAAKTAKYINTGNKSHLPKEEIIITPCEFITAYIESSNHNY